MHSQHTDDKTAAQAQIDRLRERIAELEARETGTRRSEQHFYALYDIAKALIRRRSVDEVLSVIMDHALAITGATDGFAQFVSGDPPRIEGKTVRGLFTAPPVPYTTPGEGLVGEVLKSNATLIVEDYDQWPHRRGIWPPGFTRSVMGVPLRGHGRVLGVLGISMPVPGAYFTAEMARVIEAMADLGGVALEQANLREELDQSRYFAERVAQAVPSVLYVHDLVSQRNLYVSGAIEHILGYEPSAIYALGSDLLPSLIHPDDLELAILENNRLRDGDAHTTITVEYRMRHIDGSWRWLRSRDRVFRVDDQGHPVQSVGSAQDITEERAIRDSLRYQASLLDTLADAVISADPAFNIVSWNRGAERMYGWREEEVLGQNVGLLLRSQLAPGVTQDFEPIVEELYTQGFYEGEFINTARDGREIFQWTKTTVVYDDKGAIIGTVAVNRDITAQKAAESALRNSEMRFRALFDTAPVGIVIAHPNYIVDSNPMMTAITGYSAEQLRRMNYQDITHPEDIPAEAALLAQLLKGEIDSYTIEKRYIHAEGHLIWVRVNGTMLRLVDDDMGIVIVEDITERKQAEAQEQAVERERGRRQVLADFVLEASHDFRTPLSTLYTSLYMLQRTGDDPDRRQHHLSVLQQQAEHLERLVEGLFTMARLDATDAFTLGRLSVDEMLMEMANKVRSRRENPFAGIHYEPAQGLPYVMADGVELNRALYQIVNNAVAFTPPDGDIRLSAHQDGGYVVVTVQDNGAGIDAADLPRIFDRFYRGDKARTRGGLGLGLSIAQKIIEKHGGHITVESAPGQGAVFHVYLGIASE